MAYSNPTLKNPFPVEVDFITQNRESNRKTNQGKVADETNAVKASHEDVKTKNSNGADVITKRQKLAKTLAAKKGKNTNKSTANSFYSKSELKGIAKANSLLFNARIQAKKEGWGEPDVDMGRVDILQQLLSPKNLKNCKASPEELATAVSAGKQISRSHRKLMSKILPQVLDAAAQAYANHGIDLSSPPAKTSQSIDSAILASMIASSDANDILQRLGVQAQETNTEIQESYSKSVVDKGLDVFNKNKEALSQQQHESCKEKTLKILGDVVGVICIALEMPAIGVAIILASNGLIQKWITDLASDMHIPPYALKSIIMALTIIVSVALAVESGGSSLSMIAGVCGKCALVAGMTGWVTDTVGVIDTGSLDESKYPAWVQWTGMAITIALGLAGGMESIINGVQSAMASISDAASSTMRAITGLFTDAAENEEAVVNVLEDNLEDADAAAAKDVDDGNVARTANDGAVNEVAETGSASASKFRMLLSKILKKLADAKNYLCTMKTSSMIAKALTKALDARDAIFAAEDATGVSEEAQGTVSNAEKAESFVQKFVPAAVKFQQLSRILMVATNATQATVEVQLAQIKREVADCLNEAAHFMADAQLMDSFVSTLTAAIKDSQGDQKEYAKENADEMELIAAIISDQRRGLSVVTSA